MINKCNIKVVITFITIIILLTTLYILNYKQKIGHIDCTASLSQHYPGETVKVFLSYSMRKNKGILSISGSSGSNIKFNRKIFFTFTITDDIYHLTSISNFKFPDDNADDLWLSQREPDFFVYPKKSIFFRIVKQSNESYIFMTDSIPTYICNVE